MTPVSPNFLITTLLSYQRMVWNGYKVHNVRA